MEEELLRDLGGEWLGRCGESEPGCVELTPSLARAAGVRRGTQQSSLAPLAEEPMGELLLGVCAADEGAGAIARAKTTTRVTAITEEAAKATTIASTDDIWVKAQNELFPTRVFADDGRCFVVAWATYMWRTHTTA